MTRAAAAARPADVVLRDGSTLHVRPVRAEDEAGLLQLLAGMSAESRLYRFCGVVGASRLAEAARLESHVDYPLTFGLVATSGPAARIVGHAMYASNDGRSAEVAFAIADEFQGKGLGTLLAGQLAQVAAANGIATFEAQVMAENYRMLGVFRHAGFPVELRARAGEIHVTFPTALSDPALLKFEDRDRIASVAAMRAFLEPASVAVIGASRERGTLSGEIFHNLLHSGFPGPVYPVNSRARVVQSVLAYPSVLDVPGEVSLAVLSVPAQQMLRVADECGRKGVRALVAISAGFAESGDAGRRLQDELLATCRSYGMRLIGPNCMGVLNTDPSARLDALFVASRAAPGRIGFSSQSGALGKAMMDHAASLGLGLSSFVSVGNKADISGNDLLAYWEEDARTDVILLYLESFGNPRKFARVARRVARSKPIVVVKSGRTRAGSRATGSHTGALLASSDVSVDALFRHSGVIRTDTLEELFDVAALLSAQPPPRGPRVAIVTNAGGPGILCADACEAEGLSVPELAAATQERLRALAPPQASVTNPVDLIASATAEQYRRALEVLAEDPNLDALIAIYIPPLPEGAQEVAAAVRTAALAAAGRKTMAAVFMDEQGLAGRLAAGDGARIPSYRFPEAAAIALARAARYGEWRSKPQEAPPVFPDVRREEAFSIVAAALRRGGGWLEPCETQRLLSCYGLPVLELREADSPEAAAAAARALGASVAVKAKLAGAAHKSDVGAVRLGLATAEAARRAAEDIRHGLAAHDVACGGFVVQPMAEPGVEMIVGVVHDRQFGPVIACGAGGTLVELLRDVAIRLSPLSRADAEEMLRELKSLPLLQGYRGRPPADTGALVDALLRVSALAEELPDVAELDLNPLLVHERGASIVDARVRVEAAAPEAALGARSAPPIAESSEVMHAEAVAVTGRAAVVGSCSGLEPGQA